LWFTRGRGVEKLPALATLDILKVSIAKIDEVLCSVRLIHLADFGGPYPGSFIPAVRSLLRAGKEKGWRIGVIFSNVARGRTWLSDFERDQIPVLFAPDTSLFSVCTWLREILEKQPEPTILHTHYTTYDLPAVLAAKGGSNTIVFWHVRNEFPPGLRARLRSSVKYGVFARGVEQVLCVSPGVAASVRARFSPRDRVTFLPNAIDTDLFPIKSNASKRFARARLGLPQDAIILLHFGLGTHWHRKGGDIYLKAVKRLLERGNGRLIALTVGGGEGDAAALRDELGLGEVVQVIEPMTDVQTLYAASDVYVLSSRSEGLPFSIPEALLSGVPVVASHLPGPAYVGRHVAACRLVAPDSVDVADGISALLNLSPTERLEQQAAARSWIVANMALRPWTQQMLRRYKAALA
jgi:glycosyltransferase involved in cell wall biosynthesis